MLVEMSYLYIFDRRRLAISSEHNSRAHYIAHRLTAAQFRDQDNYVQSGADARRAMVPTRIDRNLLENNQGTKTVVLASDIGQPTANLNRL